MILSYSTMKISKDRAKDPSITRTYIKDYLKRISLLGVNTVETSAVLDEWNHSFRQMWLEEIWRAGFTPYDRGTFCQKEFQEPNGDRTKGLYGTTKRPTFDNDYFIPLVEKDIEWLGDIIPKGKQIIYGICPEGTGHIEWNEPQIREKYQKFYQFINEYEDASYSSQQVSEILSGWLPDVLKKYVVIDHYTESPAQLVEDINKVNQKTGLPVILGEWNNLAKKYPDTAFYEAIRPLFKSGVLVGMNFWDETGNDLWNVDGTLNQRGRDLRDFYASLQEVTDKDQVLQALTEVEEGLQMIAFGLQGHIDDIRAIKAQVELMEGSCAPYIEKIEEVKRIVQ